MFCRLLLVDDDPGILAALRRELLRPPVIGTDAMEIEGFRLPSEALARAAAPDAAFDAVIVDYHMPHMDGIRLLEQLRQLQPDAVRILLTGLIGLDGAIDAVNKAQVDHLLTKPWHEYDLKGRIALALHERQLLRNAKVGAGDTATQDGLPLPQDHPIRHILLVDDEISVLQALQRELNASPLTPHEARPSLTVSLASSADEALSVCRQRCPDLIIADYQMPGTDGITLLHQLRTLCPRAVRTLISGRADTAVLLDAINIAGVHHFLPKPWSRADLRNLLAEARHYRALL